MLATSGAVAGDQAGFVWEVKWDGWRAIADMDGVLRVRTRPGREVSESLPELISATTTGADHVTLEVECIDRILSAAIQRCG